MSLLKGLFKLLKAYFMVTGFLVTLGLVLLIALISKNIQTVNTPMAGPQPVAEATLVHMDWNTVNIRSSSGSQESLDALLGELMGHKSDLYIPHFEGQLKRLGKDERVKGLFLEVGTVSGSLAEISELRQALLNFKKEYKKPIYVWFARADTASYYLSSVANEITMPETGTLFLLGPVVDSVFFGGAAKKVGLNFEVIKTGTFKSAFETFTRNKPSEAYQEAYSALEKSLRNQINQDIHKSYPKLSEKAVEEAFKVSIHQADEALKRNIVSKLNYLPDTLLAYEKQHEAEILPFEDYGKDLSFSYDEEELKEEGIALIEATGEIKLNSDDSHTITPEALSKELKWALEEDKVKAVVLRISSGGGDALSSDLIWRDVKALAEAKPLIASFGSVAASGGYYIAAPAKKIFANPTSITGSIGTISMIMNAKDFEEKYGISFFLETGSDRKKLLDPGSEASEEDRRILKNGANQFYDIFINRVAEGRNLSEAYIRSIAEGRVWTGEQALERKLIDAYGGLREALKEAKTQAGFSEEDSIPVMRYSPEIKSFQDCFKNAETLKRCFSTGGALVKAKMGIGSTGLQNFDLKFVKKHLEEKFQTNRVLMLWPDEVSFR